MLAPPPRRVLWRSEYSLDRTASRPLVRCPRWRIAGAASPTPSGPPSTTPSPGSSIASAPALSNSSTCNPASAFSSSAPAPAL